ncbi:hypothetical protein FHG87_017811, partial [Trinorchestia longiramus]
RTNQEFTNKDQSEHHIGNSPLQQLIGIKMVDQFPLDYMHLILLEIVKKLLHCW